MPNSGYAVSYRDLEAMMTAEVLNTDKAPTYAAAIARSSRPRANARHRRGTGR